MTEEKKPERNGRFANLGISDHGKNKLSIDTKKNQRSHKVLPDNYVETNQMASSAQSLAFITPVNKHENSQAFNMPSVDTHMEGKKDAFQMKDGDEVVGYKFEEVLKPDGKLVKKRYKVVKRPRQEYVWLTREEKREIGVIFNTFDKDKSGSIEVGELRDAMKALGLKMDKEEIKEVMDKADKDGSGTIEPDEFLQHMAVLIQER